MRGTIFFSLLLFAINKAYFYPRNIISNIIMIFNINSTRGQTLVLTCVARVTCLGVQVYEFEPHAGKNFLFHFYCLRLTRLTFILEI